MKRHIIVAALLTSCFTVGPVTAQDQTAPSTEAAVDLEAAEKLYKRQCAGCHGPKAQGVASYPKLAAQPAEYLTAKLEAYRSGETLGPNTPLMRPRAQNLSDQDISNLAAFISSLPG